MNSLSIAILFGILINISCGFLTNCTRNLEKPCTAWLKPGEPAYKKFLGCLKDPEKIGIGLALGENDPSKIKKENELIESKVPTESIKCFFSKLKNRPYAPNRKIVIVPYDSRMSSRLNKQRRK
uniref:Uncharacterized protein n=1 Tax=Strongyloides papillosus TaxID=174720 RepID=A0A0N5B3J6_STREA